MKARARVGFYRWIDPDRVRLVLLLAPVVLTIISLFLPVHIVMPYAPHTGGMCNGGG